MALHVIVAFCVFEGEGIGFKHIGWRIFVGDYCQLYCVEYFSSQSIKDAMLLLRVSETRIGTAYRLLTSKSNKVSAFGSEWRRRTFKGCPFLCDLGTDS